MDKRIFELALRGLEADRQKIEQEIQEIKRQLVKGAGPGGSHPAKRKRRHMSAALKKAQSKRMKAYWAKRKKAEKQG